MELDAFYLQLATLTEAPDSPLRRLPRSQWSAAQQHAVDLCELMAVIDATVQYGNPLERTARLAQLQADDVARMDAALLAIGATTQRRALARCYHFLTRGLQMLDATARHQQIDERLHASPALLYRLAGPIDTDELPHLLQGYLRRCSALPSLMLPHPPPVAAVRADATIVTADQGSRAIYLLRDNLVSQQLLERWMQRRGGAVYFGQGLHRHVSGYFELCHLARERVRFHGPLGDGIAGELRLNATAQAMPFPPLNQQAELEWQTLARRFRWALGQASIGTQTVLAWTSDEAEIVAEFEHGLKTVAAQCLVSAFRRLGQPPYPVHGLCFQEDRPYGTAALVAAACDGTAPWLLAQLNIGTGHWWRKASARLPAVACCRMPYYNRDSLLVIYHGSDREAFLELWSHLSSDDNVTAAAASGKLNPEMLLQRMTETSRSIESDAMRHLAGTDGWIYEHVWGGGSGEHYALFYSADTQISRQVQQFARDGVPDRWITYW